MSNPAIDLFRSARSRRDIGRLLRNVGIGTVTMTLPFARPRAADELTYYTWAGYDTAEMHAIYEAKHGGLPNFTLFGDETEALMKVQGGFTPDISHPCLYDIVRWRDAGVIRSIDSSRLDEWDNIFPELKAVSGSKETGEPWLFPFDWGNGSILYRHDLIEFPEQSWSIFFDEKYDSRLSMWDSSDAAVSVAGLVARAANPFDMTDVELVTARALLEKQNKLLRFYWTDPTLLEQSLAAGEIAGAYAWNSAFMNLQRAGIPVSYMQPKEGMLTWVCGMVSMTDGLADDAMRYEFMNAMLAPETGAWLIETFGFGHANRYSFELAGPKLTAALALPENPAEMFANTVVMPPMDPAVRQKYIAMFEEIKITF